MNRIDALFTRLRTSGRKALVAFLMAGDPSAAESLSLMRAVAEAGADMLEVGVPFSDPLADGPTNQAAAARALAAGMTPAGVLSLVAAYRRGDPERPVAVLTYVNPVLAFGEEAFCREAQAAGVDALVVPDVSLEESHGLRAVAEAHGLYLIPFLAPTTPPDRMRRVAEVARGFIYVVSVTGVTGAREGLLPRAVEVLTRARAWTQTPLVVGFGISRGEQARALAAHADGIIVGSALVDRIARAAPGQREEAAAELVRDIRAGLGA